MSHKRDEDRLDVLISQAVDLGRVEFDRRKWLDRLAGPEVDHAKSLTLKPIWRYIMESKMTRYSVAALIVLTAGVVLLNPLRMSRNDGVALAAVQEKVGQIDTVVLRGQKVFSCVDEPNVTLALNTVKYISKQYGYTEEGRRNGALLYRVVLNRTQNQFLLMLPLWKKCVRRPCTEGQIQLMEKLTPTGVINVFLASDYKKLGPAVIDGTKVEGFEVRSVTSFKDVMPQYLFDVQQGKGTVWVRTDDLLPIRLEGDLLIGKSLATMLLDVHLHETAVLESYNIELSEDLFKTDIPEGYTELRLTDFLPAKLSLAGLSVLPLGSLIWRRTRQRKATGRSDA